jgi:hypothetical protein
MTTFGFAADGVHLLSKGFEFGIGYTRLGVSVSDMPFEIRNVPVHRDDLWSVYGQGPVTQLEYDCNHSISLSILYDRVYGTGETDPLRFSWGFGLDWMIDVGTDFAERNYMGAPGTEQRGYGTALTYVTLNQGGMIPPLGNRYSDIFLNWTPRIKFEVAPFGGKFRNVWFGTSVSYYTIVAQNGWDRYDKLEVRKDYTLLHDFPVRLYVTFLNKKDDLGVGLTAGVQFQPGIKTDTGNRAGISVDPVSYFMAISYRF